MYVIHGISTRLQCYPSEYSQKYVKQHTRHKSKTHYEVLGVKKTASSDDIRKAFLQLSKQLHPDINKSDPKNHEKFVQVNEAYTVLSKPIARQEYDLGLSGVAEQPTVHTMYRRTNQDTAQGEKSETFNWDDYLGIRRDNTKDGRRQHTNHDNYYGVKGVKRMPNSYIVGGCVGLMAIGALLHFFAIRKTHQWHKRVLDERDAECQEAYLTSKQNARVHGNIVQLQILEERMARRLKEQNQSYKTSKAESDKLDS